MLRFYQRHNRDSNFFYRSITIGKLHIMKNTKHISILIYGFAALSLGACATAPSPVEVCSAQWIAPRVEDAMIDFKRDTTKSFKVFKKSAQKLSDGKTLGPIQMFTLMSAISSLSQKIEKGQPLKDLRTLSRSCNDPDLIKTALNDFMKNQGISDNFIQFINGLKLYSDLINTTQNPDNNL